MPAANKTDKEKELQEENDSLKAEKDTYQAMRVQEVTDYLEAIRLLEEELAGYKEAVTLLQAEVRELSGD